MGLPEVSVGCFLPAMPVRRTGSPLRLQPPGTPAQVVSPMHSEDAAMTRRRLDLCTIGLGMCYVGDLGLWWGCACSVAIPFQSHAGELG